MRAGCSVVLLLGLLALIRADSGLSDTSVGDTEKAAVRVEESGDVTEFSTRGLSTSTDSVNNGDTGEKGPVNNGEKDPINATSNPSDCNEYCSLSYPPHTYPQPLHYKACISGCKSAQVDALIAWPAKPDGNACTNGCQEVYSDAKQRYACQAGCHAPTWDTMFPNRAHLYQHSLPSAQEASEVGSIMAQMMSALMAQTDFFSPREFDQLQEHAVEMEMIIVPLRQFDITVLGDEDVLKVHQYNMDSNDGSPQLSGSSSESSSWLTYHESHQECVWFRHRLILSRFLLFLSVVLAILGIFMCFSSFSSSSKKSDNGKKRHKKGSFVCCSVKMTPDTHKVIQSYQKTPVLSRKAPYDLGTEFLIPFTSDNEKKVNQSLL